MPEGFPEHIKRAIAIAGLLADVLAEHERRGDDEHSDEGRGERNRSDVCR